MQHGLSNTVVAATPHESRYVVDAEVSQFAWEAVTDVYRQVRHKLIYSIVTPQVKEVIGADAG
jgi:hypothetical protein